MQAVALGGIPRAIAIGRKLTFFLAFPPPSLALFWALEAESFLAALPCWTLGGCGAGRLSSVSLPGRHHARVAASTSVPSLPQAAVSKPIAAPVNTIQSHGMDSFTTVLVSSSSRLPLHPIYPSLPHTRGHNQVGTAHPARMASAP